MEVLQIQSLCKVYGTKVLTKALNGIDLSIYKGERVGIMGSSGSGKTTLLNLIATIDEPTSGQILLAGENSFSYSQREKAKFRRKLGFIFQDFQLLQTLTVRENISLPLAMQGARNHEIEKQVNEVANQLKIESILARYSFELSGGQAQQVAIARAIIHKPTLILADEPTGNLDSHASRKVMELLCLVQDAERSTILLVTHDPVVASYCHRVIFMKDGKLFTELHKGEQQQIFFQNIMNTLSLLEGDLA